MSRWVVLAWCLSVVLAKPALAGDAALTVHYDGYAKGLNLFAVDLVLSLQPAAYRMQVSFRLTGVLGAVIHGDGTTVVDGRFDGPRPTPRTLVSTGQFRGIPHVTRIDWHDDLPKVLQLAPPPEPEREAVPEREQAHTVDGLSAIAGMLHRVNQSGRCEGAARTFDGVRLTEFAARTTGQEVLAPSDRSSFAGPALRCDISGQMIGGFMRDSDPALRKPKQGAVWLARLAPGQPFVPVRIVFYSDGEPAATLYLNAATAAH